MTATLTYGIPQQSLYGAAEMKVFIQKNTYRGFFMALAMLIAIIAISIIALHTTSKIIAGVGFASTEVTFGNQTTPDVQVKSIEEPKLKSLISYGNEHVAGKPVAVPPMKISMENEFETFNKINEAMSTPGNTSVPTYPNKDISKLTISSKNITADTERIIPSDTFIYVEEEPKTDMNELRKKVIYPDLAIKTKTEGRVVVRVYIDKTGEPKLYKIDFTESKLLTQAAVDAVMSAKFVPALQNKMPIGCWISIPVEFRLK